MISVSPVAEQGRRPRQRPIVGGIRQDIEEPIVIEVTPDRAIVRFGSAAERVLDQNEVTGLIVTRSKTPSPRPWKTRLDFDFALSPLAKKTSSHPSPS